MLAKSVLIEPRSEQGRKGTQGRANCQKRPTLRGSVFCRKRDLAINCQISKQIWAATDSRMRESPLKSYRPRTIDDLPA